MVWQKFGSEIAQAPWNPLTDSDKPPDEIRRHDKQRPPPVYDGFWKDNDSDILSRLDAASEKLKDKRGSAQEEAHDEPSPKEKDGLDTEDPHPSNPESPSLLKSTWNDLRDNLKDAISSHPSWAYDTPDQPTQGDTPYALQQAWYHGTSPPPRDTGQFQH